jgi:hypothetical protein
MKVTINRLRVLEITSGADKLKSLTGVKLTYAITKNMKALQAEAETTKESRTTSDEMLKYNEEYKVIIEAEAKRDDEGNFIPAGNGQIALKNGSEFKAKMKVLDEKYKAAIEAAKAKDKEFEKFLKESFEFDFFQFEESHIPESITQEQMGLVMEMIKE